MRSKKQMTTSGTTAAQVRMSEELREYCEKAASICGLDFSSWWRLRALEAAERDIRRFTGRNQGSGTGRKKR